MRFRPHRGSLIDAMKEEQELDGLQGLVDYVRDNYRDAVTTADIEATPYGGDDSRIGWKDVHIVTLKDWGVIGYCEGMPK